MTNDLVELADKQHSGFWTSYFVISLKELLWLCFIIKIINTQTNTFLDMAWISTPCFFLNNVSNKTGKERKKEGKTGLCGNPCQSYQYATVKTPIRCCERFPITNLFVFQSYDPHSNVIKKSFPNIVAWQRLRRFQFGQSSQTIVINSELQGYIWAG